jgi:shikimate kinase
VAVVILTGFMATGKTEVGRKLAALLGAPFVDTDALVESATGRTIADIFARDGEPHFRALEREAVERACAVDGAVVATGGGTLLDPENRRRLAAAGPVVCLTAEPDELLRRVGGGADRPLLAGPDRLARIRELIAARASSYASAAHTIDTTGLGVDDVVARVRSLVAGR